jgi:hypothetical protein
VTDRETPAEIRRDDGPADQRDLDLAAMRVAGDEQSDAVGRLREDVRVVGEGQDRPIVVDAAQRPLDIVRR